jgi:hypothetical protein
MTYQKNSPLTLVKKTIKQIKKLTENQMSKLQKHKNNHINNNNKIIEKHMKVMNDLMKQGMSFDNSHKIAQKKYPLQRKIQMKNKKKGKRNV